LLCVVGPFQDRIPSVLLRPVRDQSPDSADRVSKEYEGTYPFADGTILGVAVDVGDDKYFDLEKEAVAAFARD